MRMTENTKCKNCTNEDISVCPHCESSLFFLCDGNRIFCYGCLKELRNNDNFQEGKLILKKPNVDLSDYSTAHLLDKDNYEKVERLLLFSRMGENNL